MPWFRPCPLERPNPHPLVGFSCVTCGYPHPSRPSLLEPISASYALLFLPQTQPIPTAHTPVSHPPRFPPHFLPRNAVTRTRAAADIKVSQAVQQHSPAVLWFAPELLRLEPFDFQSQVWSFGVVLREMLTLELPYKAVTEAQSMDRVMDRDMDRVMLEVAYHKRRPEPPPHVSPFLGRMLRLCCAQLAEDRPTFATLVADLEEHQRADGFRGLKGPALAEATAPAGATAPPHHQHHQHQHQHEPQQQQPQQQQPHQQQPQQQQPQQQQLAPPNNGGSPPFTGPGTAMATERVSASSLKARLAAHASRAARSLFSVSLSGRGRGHGRSEGESDGGDAGAAPATARSRGKAAAQAKGKGPYTSRKLFSTLGTGGGGGGRGRGRHGGGHAPDDDGAGPAAPASSSAITWRQLVHRVKGALASANSALPWGGGGSDALATSTGGHADRGSKLGFTTRTAALLPPKDAGLGLQLDFYGSSGNTGVLVSSVDPNGVAAKAGNVYIGDVIVGMNDVFLLGLPTEDLQMLVQSQTALSGSVVLKLAPISQVYQVMNEWLGVAPDQRFVPAYLGSSGPGGEPEGRRRSVKPRGGVDASTPGPERRRPSPGHGQRSTVLNITGEEDPDLREFMHLEQETQVHDPRVDGGGGGVDGSPNDSAALSTPDLSFVTLHGSEFASDSDAQGGETSGGEGNTSGIFDEMHFAVQQLRKSILVLDHEISSDISTIEVSTLGGRGGGGGGGGWDSNNMSQTMAVARAVHSDNVDYMSGTIQSEDKMKDIIRRTARKEREQQEARLAKLGIEEETEYDSDGFGGELDDTLGQRQRHVYHPPPSVRKEQAARKASKAAQSPALPTQRGAGDAKKKALAGGSVPAGRPAGRPAARLTSMTSRPGEPQPRPRKKPATTSPNRSKGKKAGGAKTKSPKRATAAAAAAAAGHADDMDDWPWDHDTPFGPSFSSEEEDGMRPKVLGFVTTSHFNPGGSHLVNEKRKSDKDGVSDGGVSHTCKHCGYRADTKDKLHIHERAKHPRTGKTGARSFALSPT